VRQCRLADLAIALKEASLASVTWLVLVAAALCTSAISAVIGMGGGIALLGVMAAVLPPAAVVPLHGVVQLCSNTTRTVVFLRHVHWGIVAIYAPPMVVGVALAAAVWQGGQMSWFRPLIGAFILVFLVWRRVTPRLRGLPLWTFAPVGLAVGFLTVFVGATGPFVAPFFLRDDLAKEQVVATKAVCQSWGHLLKVPAFLALGFSFERHLGLLVVLVGGVVLGTLAGRRLLSRLSEQAFVRLFEATLVVIAVWLLVQSGLAAG